VPCLILIEHVASGWHFSPTFSAITLATRMNQCLISDLFGVCILLTVKNAAAKLLGKTEKRCIMPLSREDLQLYGYACEHLLSSGIPLLPITRI